MSRPTVSRVDIDALERETGFGWCWFIVLGLVLLALGAVAMLNLSPAATSLFAVGAFMLIGAIAQLATRLLVPEGRGTGFLVFGIALYGAAGVLLMANPTVTSDALTVALASALILSGVMRMRLSAAMPPFPGWGWITGSGLVTVVVGFAFIHFLLLHPVWLLGLGLAFDLFFQGACAIAFGLALRRNRGVAR
ncbi:MAG: DUF308 domain-containing protein [Burkholderiales bacterium]